MRISSTKRRAALLRAQSAAGQGPDACGSPLCIGNTDTEALGAGAQTAPRPVPQPLLGLRQPHAAGVQLQAAGTVSVRSAAQADLAAGNPGHNEHVTNDGAQQILPVRQSQPDSSNAARQPLPVPQGRSNSNDVARLPLPVPQAQPDATNAVEPAPAPSGAQGVPRQVPPPLLFATRPVNVRTWVPSLQTVLWATMVLAPSLAWLPALGFALPSTLTFLSIAGLWLGCGLALWALHLSQTQGLRAEMLRFRYADDAAALLAAAAPLQAAP